jgi:hypothetical protein
MAMRTESWSDQGDSGNEIAAGRQGRRLPPAGPTAANADPGGLLSTFRVELPSRRWLELAHTQDD